jgi:hypothetical protein
MTASRTFLFLAQAFFLWTFLSTQGAERMADAGLLAGFDPAGIERLAYSYASRWRHGFCSFWPFYMPGFFAVSIATWFWSMGRPLRKLIPEALAIMSAALVAALAFSSVGAALFFADLERDTAIVPRGVVLGAGLRGAAGGFYTLVAWSAVVLAIHRSVWWRSWKPLAVPALLEAVLFAVRPFTLDDLSGEWFRAVVSGNARAVGSLAAAPFVLAALIYWQVAWQRRHSAAPQ